METGQNFTLYKSFAASITVTVTGTDGSTPLSSSYITWELASAPGGAALVTKSIANGGIVETSTAGTYTITLADTDISALVAGQAYWHRLYDSLTDLAGMSGYVYIEAL